MDTRAGAALLIAIGVLTALALLCGPTREEGADLAGLSAVRNNDAAGVAAARAGDHHGVQRVEPAHRLMITQEPRRIRWCSRSCSQHSSWDDRLRGGVGPGTALTLSLPGSPAAP
ncbi:hypothetical protein QJS66_16080 [Kocuria rhizophila]|nr:hypothetical protein QJS66_16080 [Kocuria rhizophila]